MEKHAAAIGIYGMTDTGLNLAQNLAGHGFLTAVSDRSPEKVDSAAAPAVPGVTVQRTPAGFTASLELPRRILILPRTAAAVDSMIADLLPGLAPGDILIDGGNSFYRETLRRFRELDAKGIHFVGLGMSGGVDGALSGPSLMFGASPEDWALLRPVFEPVSARASDGTPCCGRVGSPGAGHFVKMVHDGIEYADMQLISETYLILRKLLNLDPARIAEVFAGWNRGPMLESYLADITAKILAEKDPATGLPLVDVILDSAGQLGSGKWLSQIALELGTPGATIAESVFARNLSTLKEERVKTSKLYGAPVRNAAAAPEISDLERALFASMLCSYAQGFQLLRAADAEFHWRIDYSATAALWRGGSLVRAGFLDEIVKIFSETPFIQNLLMSPWFVKNLSECSASWRRTAAGAMLNSLPVPAMASALAWFDSSVTERLPAGLIQAQRDYFGSHSYERTDRPRGRFFHTDWLNLQKQENQQ